MKEVKTYASNQVLIAAGPHAVSGYAEDSFVTIEQNGDGIMKKVGCDGEVARAVSPDSTYRVTIALLQTSQSNSFFQSMLDRDMQSGDGLFPVLIKDMRGVTIFSAKSACVLKPAGRQYGRDTNARQWVIDTGEATLVE